MKAILMSIRPEWVAKILNGEKTIEVRKTAPKCELPIDVYIYCTKNEMRPIYLPWEFPIREEKGAIVTDCVFKKGNGKVVAKFTLRKVDTVYRPDPASLDYTAKDMDARKLFEHSCLSEVELGRYLCYKYGYAWHISDLEIFDEPKELSDFGLKKAPQSWCYVEAKE